MWTWDSLRMTLVGDVGYCMNMFSVLHGTVGQYIIIFMIELFSGCQVSSAFDDVANAVVVMMFQHGLLRLLLFGRLRVPRLHVGRPEDEEEDGGGGVERGADEENGAPGGRRVLYVKGEISIIN